MKITVLIGNGFDISLGIKSSYGDFYKWYCNQKSDVAHIQQFRDDIKNDISRNVPDEEKTWADFELGLGKYTEKFTPESVDEYIDCLVDAQASIRQYLLTEQSGFSLSNFTDKSVSAFRESIRDFYGELPDLDRVPIAELLNRDRDRNSDISFITFNYTDTLDRILNSVANTTLSSWTYNAASYTFKLNKSVLHLHGTTEEFPVLGVNDESQIINKALLSTPQFKDFTIKADNIRALGRTWHSQAETLISNSKIVCVLGMSLGATDAKWWRKLVQWLIADGNRHLILYWYTNNPPGGIASIRHLQAVNTAKERLLSYTEKFNGQEREHIKARIHVVINTTKFLHLEKVKTTKPVPLNEIMAAVQQPEVIAQVKAVSSALLENPLLNQNIHEITKV